MVGMYGPAPLFDSMGIIFPVYSYGPTIAVSFTADRDMLPDPDAMAAALRQSFEALKRAAVQPAAAPPVEQNDNRPARKQARRKGA